MNHGKTYYLTDTDGVYPPVVCLARHDNAAYDKIALKLIEMGFTDPRNDLRNFHVAELTWDDELVVLGEDE